MPLTPEQIAKFEAALEEAGPDSDPNWAVTKQLLTLVTVQGREVIELQAQLEAYMGAGEAASDALFNALQKDADFDAVSNGISQAEANEAMNGLNDAIEAYRNGAQIASYAGNVLKFAAAIIL